MELIDIFEIMSQTPKGEKYEHDEEYTEDGKVVHKHTEAYWGEKVFHITISTTTIG